MKPKNERAKPKSKKKAVVKQKKEKAKPICQASPNRGRMISVRPYLGTALPRVPYQVRGVW